MFDIFKLFATFPSVIFVALIRCVGFFFQLKQQLSSFSISMKFHWLLPFNPQLVQHNTISELLYIIHMKDLNMEHSRLTLDIRLKQEHSELISVIVPVQQLVNCTFILNHRWYQTDEGAMVELCGFFFFFLPKWETS